MSLAQISSGTVFFFSNLKIIIAKVISSKTVKYVEYENNSEQKQTYFKKPFT